MIGPGMFDGMKGFLWLVAAGAFVADPLVGLII